MQTLCLVLLTFLSIVIGSCGNPSAPETATSAKDDTPYVSPYDELQAKYEVCKCYDTVAVNDDVAQFPFNPEIVAVAYEYNSKADCFIPATTAKSSGLSVNKRFDPAHIKRADTLTNGEKKQLEKLCLNRFEKCTANEYYTSDGDCIYSPHHCVVFYQSDSIVAYLEVCFICESTDVWPNKLFGPRCGDFDCEIRYFFRSMGFADDMLMLDHCPGYVADTKEIWKGYYE